MLAISSLVLCKGRNVSETDRVVIFGVCGGGGGLDTYCLLVLGKRVCLKFLVLAGFSDWALLFARRWKQNRFQNVAL
jgi:hypothetical protein